MKVFVVFNGFLFPDGSYITKAIYSGESPVNALDQIELFCEEYLYRNGKFDILMDEGYGWREATIECLMLFVSTE